MSVADETGIPVEDPKPLEFSSYSVFVCKTGILDHVLEALRSQILKGLESLDGSGLYIQQLRQRNPQALTEGSIGPFLTDLQEVRCVYFSLFCIVEIGRVRVLRFNQLSI